MSCCLPIGSIELVGDRRAGGVNSRSWIWVLESCGAGPVPLDFYADVLRYLGYLEVVGNNRLGARNY